MSDKFWALPSVSVFMSNFVVNIFTNIENPKVCNIVSFGKPNINGISQFHKSIIGKLSKNPTNTNVPMPYRNDFAKIKYLLDK